ncbi:unnamed protein product [Protopolystoma xenopodis]|uniref:Uncharacterized protein n=1 Tax=Protopolystoma xenopodis TaxID=117903 RepID=A0A448WAW4_9PLAT|nr:unnamed protein product [Protopolystoma xenopodis]
MVYGSDDVGHMMDKNSVQSHRSRRMVSRGSLRIVQQTKVQDNHPVVSRGANQVIFLTRLLKRNERCARFNDLSVAPSYLCSLCSPSRLADPTRASYPDLPHRSVGPISYAFSSKYVALPGERLGSDCMHGILGIAFTGHPDSTRVS